MRAMGMRYIVLALGAYLAAGEDFELCPKGRKLVPQEWGSKVVELNLQNWAGAPLLAKVFELGGGQPKTFRLQTQGGGTDRTLRAKAGSVLRIWYAPSSTEEKPVPLFERMVVPHDGSMGTSGIFPCGTVNSEEFEALLVNSTCDDSVPTKFWNCARPAPPTETWPKDKYGFSPEEVDAVPRGLRTYGPYTTEANTPWDAAPITIGPGFLMMKMPEEVYAALKAVYSHSKASSRIEGDVAGHYSNYFGQKDEGNAWTMVNLDGFQRERGIVSKGIRRVLTWWTRTQLQHEATYGIRVYHKDSVLINHRDVPTTHFVSAVLQLNQTAEEGWPLLIETQRETDTKPAQYAEIYLQPGYMALYEGARLKHGRPKRFNGSEFAMAFTHNRPVDLYPDSTYKEPKQREPSNHDFDL